VSCVKETIYTLYLLLRGEYKICPGAMFALPTIFWMLPFACALDGNTPGNFKRMRRIRSFSGKQQNVQGHIKHISWERWKTERCNKAETRREVSSSGILKVEKRNHLFSESRESSPFDLRTPHEREDGDTRSYPVLGGIHLWGG
jgi:hypothetical protein